MAEGGRHRIREALERRQSLRDERRLYRPVRPTKDAWGVLDLWDNHETQFRREEEPLRGAVCRWTHLLFNNAIDAYVAYLEGVARFLMSSMIPKLLGAAIAGWAAVHFWRH